MALNRRNLLLAAASALAIHVATPASAFLFSGEVWSGKPFWGNNRAVITELGGDIVCSREGDTIYTREGVVFSASGITGVGSDDIFSDVEYTWNMGDTSNSPPMLKAYVVWPYTGTTVNPNTDQIGPMAAYRYPVAGTYVVTCYARATTTGGGYIKKVFRKQITVADFETAVANGPGGNGVIHFDSRAAAGGDGSAGAPYNLKDGSGNYISTDLENALNLGRVLIKIANGSSWTMNVTVSGDAMVAVSAIKSLTQIISYSSAANPSDVRPKFSANMNGVGSQHVFRINSVPYSWDSFVLDGIDFDVSGAPDAVLSHTQQEVLGQSENNVTFANSRMFVPVGTTNIVSVMHFRPTTSNGAGGTAMQKVMRWNLELISEQALASATLSQVLGYGANNWDCTIGCYISGHTKISNVHVVNLETVHSQALFKWNLIAGRANSVSYNGNANGAIQGKSPYYVISEVNLSNMGVSGVSGFDISNTQTDYGPIVTIDAFSWDSVAKVVTCTVNEGVPRSWFGGGSPDVAIYDCVGNSNYNNDARITVIDDTHFTYKMANDPGAAPSSGKASSGRFRFLVLERCAINNIQSSTCTNVFAVEEITIRDNLVWNCPGASLTRPNSQCGPFLKSKSYRNYVYQTAGTGAPVFGFASTTTANSTSTISGTLMTVAGVVGTVAPGQIVRGTGVTVGTTVVKLLTGTGKDGTMTVDRASTAGPTALTLYPFFSFPQQLTDNKVYDLRSGAGVCIVAQGTFADMQSVGWMVDGNTWFYPNLTSQNPFNNNPFSNNTFSTWQSFGFDPGTTNPQNPNWNDPANGDFRPAP